MSKDSSPKSAKQSTPKSAAKTDNVLSRFLALEQRVLLDAAAVETAGEVAADAAIEHAPVDDSASQVSDAFSLDELFVSPLSSVGGAPEILFVDAGVENYEALIGELGPNVEVHVLQGDGWASQVQAVLSRRDGDVAAIHLVSHGGEGRLTLGGDTVNQQNLDQYSRVWSAMAQALTEEGDLLFYGCDVAGGEAGASFVAELAERTGADVAASEDTTGVQALGGDWELEHQAGTVEAASLFTESNNDFMGLLADGWVQDTEITAGTGGVAITQTTDGNDWKFVGTPGSNKVDIYWRNPTTGVWGLNATVTGNGSGNFGYEVAAAGNKVAVSAPDYNFGDGNDFGRVYVYTWNGSNWTTSPQTIGYRHATGSGRTGYSGGSSDISDSRGAAGRFGHSLDLAYDGAGGYKLVVGNPYEDWWQYDNDDNDSAWGGSSRTRYERDDVGVAHVYSAASHGNFGFTSQLESQTDNGTMDNHYFGAVSATTYDVSTGTWWVAVGGSGLDQVRMFNNPTAAEISNGGQDQTFAWTGNSINGLSMDDDYMAVANSADIQMYKLNSTGTAWSTKGAALGEGNAAVSVDDNRTGNGNYASLLYSSASGTFVAELINEEDANQFIVNYQISDRVESAVALERAPHTVWPKDIITSNGSNARSYHYNQAPTPADDVVSGHEDNAAITVNVVANDTDPDIVAGYPFGDALTVVGVGSSTFGATVTHTGTSVTYNPTTSPYLNSLAVGQTAQDTITVTVSDGQGGTNISLLTVTITGRNDAPQTSAVTVLNPFRYQQAGTTVSYDLSDYFFDPDQGESLALTPEALSLPAGWSAVADGSLLNITIPAGAAHDSSGTVSIRVQDPQGAYSAARNFVIRVDNVNDAPYVQTPLLDKVALANYGFTFVLPELTFNDPDPAPFDDLTYTATLVGGGALPGWLEFDAENGVFTGTPSSGDAGTLDIRVTANDGAASVFDDFTLTVVDPTLNTVGQFTDGPASSSDFGFSTAISQDGNWMVVGTPGNNNSRGSVHTYQWNGSGWTWRGQVVASDGVAGDKFGYSVDINNDGSRIVVGARNDDGGAGSAYTYVRSGTTFGSQAKYVSSVRAPNDYFGASVAMNEAGNFILVGASHMDRSGMADAGAAFFTGVVTSGTTSVAANILPQDASTFDRFGTSVAFDQNILVVSSSQDTNPSGIYGRWTFDGASGVNVSAEIGGVGGTLDGSAQFFFDSERGDVLQLSAEDGKLLLNSPVDLGATWTVSSWFKNIPTTAGGWRTLTRGTADHQIIISAGGELGTYDNGGGSFLGSGWNISSLADPNGWHHLAAVGQGGNTVFYVDGVEVGSVAFQSTSDILSVGNFQGNNQRFADFIDEFEIYDRAMTQSEIRNLAAGNAMPAAGYSSAGSVYVFSTDAGLAQVAKLYAPDGRGGDMLGWSIDVDIFNEGGTRQSGIIVASSVFNDTAATDGGAVYVWRSSSLQSGALNNGGAGDGTWTLESVVTSFDTSSGDYFGNDVAVDVDEVNGGTRLVVGAPFESSNGAYSGAVYAFKYQDGVWLPEKFVDATPQGGSIANAAFFGNSVDVAGVRTVFGSRWRDTGGQINDGAAYSVELLSQGNYATRMGVKMIATGEFVLPDHISGDVFSLDTTGTMGQVSFNEDGQLVYDPQAAFSDLAAGETATDTFVYYTEQGGVTYANEVQVTIYGVAQQVAVSDDVVTVSAANPALLDVLSNDLGSELRIVSVDDSALLGALSLDASGTALTYDPQGVFDRLGAGQSVQQSFTYTVEDAEGYQLTARVVLVVQGVDDAPDAVADTATVTAGESVVIDLTANDVDRDGQDTFWVSAIDTFGTAGTVDYNGDGTLTYTAGDAFAALPVGETATDYVVYTVRDVTGNESSAVVAITVQGTYEQGDPLPLTGAGNDVAVTQGMNPVTVDVAANDEAGEVISVTQGARGNVTVTASGAVVYTPGSSLASLPLGSVYVDSFTYTLQTEDGMLSTATVRIYVNGQYVAPVLADQGEEDSLFATESVGVSTAQSTWDSGTASTSDTVEGSTLEPIQPVSVSDLALEGLMEVSEMGTEAGTSEQQDAPVEGTADVAMLGKPGLSAALAQEARVRQPDFAVLLQHLKNNVA